MELIWGILLLSAVVLGYKMGKGEPLDLKLPEKFKAAIRTEEQLDQVIEKQNRKFDDRQHRGVTHG